MVLARLHSVAKSFGATEVLRGITWQIDSGQRIGLVGDNGAGKTTLFRLINGELAPDSGSVTVHNRARVSLLEQIPHLDESATPVEWVIAGSPEVGRIEAEAEQLAELVSDPAADPGGRSLETLLDLHAEALDAYGRAGGHDFAARIGRTLAGLGMPADTHSMPLGKLSGGQRRRTALARVLLNDVDLLLLDEPTNHLDIEAIEWLQEFLLGFSGAFVAVSHDRYFLDTVCGKTVEIEDGKAREFPGAFTAYSEAKDRELTAQAKAYETQAREIRRQEEWIRWRMQQGTLKAVRQAQSRAKLLAKIERIERPTLQRPRAILHFAQPTTGSEDILEVRGLGKRYGDHALFSGVDLCLSRGNRVGLVGPNGTGKTTLLRIVLGEVLPSEGRARTGPNVRVGYYAQEREDLDERLTVLEHVARLRPDLVPEQLRTFLGRFLFSGNDVFLPIEVLSGGERSRIALASLILSRPDFLILDEPTNHLDIISREVFEDALVDYRGTILVASHDRYFLDRTIERLVIFGDEHPHVFVGNYSAWAASRREERERLEAEEAARRAEERRARSRTVARVPPRPSPPREPTAPRVSPEVLEAEIVAAEARLAEVAELLGRQETYRCAQAARSAREEYEELEARIADLYRRYEEPDG
jgi:ATP-binding cassette subfamily F protein 3